MTAPLFTEDYTKYLIKHKGRIAECWLMSGEFHTQNYGVIPFAEAEIIERIGTPEEIFN